MGATRSSDRTWSFSVHKRGAGVPRRAARAHAHMNPRTLRGRAWELDQLPNIGTGGSRRIGVRAFASLNSHLSTKLYWGSPGCEPEDTCPRAGSSRTRGDRIRMCQRAPPPRRSACSHRRTSLVRDLGAPHSRPYCRNTAARVSAESRATHRSFYFTTRG